LQLSQPFRRIFALAYLDRRERLSLDEVGVHGGSVSGCHGNVNVKKKDSSGEITNPLESECHVTVRKE